jgi:hypothetical protein
MSFGTSPVAIAWVSNPSSAVCPVYSRAPTELAQGRSGRCPGHDSPQNLSNYAAYLDRRIKAYGAIKYDIIREKAERRGQTRLSNTLVYRRDELQTVLQVQEIASRARIDCAI